MLVGRDLVDIRENGWYLHENWKQEHIFITINKVLFGEKSHLKIQYVIINPAKTTPIAPGKPLAVICLLIPHNQVILLQPSWKQKTFSAVAIRPPITNLLAQIPRTVLFVPQWNALNIPKYLSYGLPKKYTSSKIYTLLMNLTATCIVKCAKVCTD